MSPMQKERLGSSPARRRTPRARGSATLSHVHLGPDGAESRMVDVGSKAVTLRSARARASVRFPAGVLSRVLAGQGPKGPIQEVARTAALLAAKRTGELIPMCHPLALDHVAVEFRTPSPDVLEIRCHASCRGRTGVEMEALVGASVAALTVYDMCKALSREIVIETIEVFEKRGGRSGTWVKTEALGKPAPPSSVRGPVKSRRKVTRSHAR